MFENLLHWFSPGPLVPHGTCLIWNKGLIGLHVISDALITLSYYSIPFGLVYFVWHRTDLVYRWMFLLFAAFILGCGTTHLFDIWTLWHPDYLLQGVIKAGTAAVSVATAILLGRLIPQALTLPSRAELALVNSQLNQEIAERQEAVTRLQGEVAERKDAERKLRKNEARLRTILENTVEGIVTIDEHGVIELFNPAAERMFGYDSGELLGQNISRLMPPPHRNAHDGHLAEYRLAREKRIMRGQREVTGLRKDGSTFPLEIAFGEFESFGRRFTGILRDITERKRAEEALRASEERLEAALMGADLGSWDWNIQTGEAVFSDRWITMLGYARDEIEPCYDSWARRVHPDDMPRVLEVLNAHLEGKTPFYEAEHRLLTNTGQWKWVLARGRMYERDPHGNPHRAAGTHMDISAGKELEERLRQQQAQLVYIQRLTTAGQIAAMMAHELNQPLGAIANYVGGATLRFHDLLAANPALDQAMKETLRLSQRAAAIVGGVRDLVRKHEAGREWLDISTLMSDTLSLARAELVRRRIRVKSQVHAALPRIWGQRVQLQQLLLNLFLNAAEAMDDPAIGRRELTVRADLNPKKNIELSISDTGAGFPPDLAAQPFEPFVSTKPEGIGLGLSICQTIAEAHGGELSAHSVPGKGATLTVILPADPGEGPNVSQQ